jgi:hypothetical protein
MSAVLPHQEITPPRPHWVADDAVLIEPVSDFEFPANRENAGNFADSGFRVPIQTLYLTAKSVASREIPYANGAGNF